MYVLCVLKSGGPDYHAGRVEALRDSLRRHSDAPLVCFSDVDVPCRRIPLVHGWQGWWSKLELFRFNYPDPVLYVDLDTTFVDDPAPLFCERFTMLARLGRTGDVGSGVMSWRGDYSHIYRTFLANPSKYIAAYKTAHNWGDQGFIRDRLGYKADTYPVSLAMSYKGHYVPAGRTVSPDCRVVYFHGNPRPWTVPEVVK
jgi:hypothetical protein